MNNLSLEKAFLVNLKSIVDAGFTPYVRVKADVLGCLVPYFLDERGTVTMCLQAKDSWEIEANAYGVMFETRIKNWNDGQVSLVMFPHSAIDSLYAGENSLMKFDWKGNAE
jgi:stringent starvation protein B